MRCLWALRISLCWDENIQGGMHSIQLSCKQSTIRTNILIRKASVWKYWRSHTEISHAYHFLLSEIVEILEELWYRIIISLVFNTGSSRKIWKRWAELFMLAWMHAKKFSSKDVSGQEGNRAGPVLHLHWRRWWLPLCRRACSHLQQHTFWYELGLVLHA